MLESAYVVAECSRLLKNQGLAWAVAGSTPYRTAASWRTQIPRSSRAQTNLLNYADLLYRTSWFLIRGDKLCFFRRCPIARECGTNRSYSILEIDQPKH